MGSPAKRLKTDADLDANGSSGFASEVKRPELVDSNDVNATENQEKQPPAADAVIAIEAEAAEDKGSRHAMEDAWVVLPDASLGKPGKLRCAHFAIYDGHGGRQAADFARGHLHANIMSSGLPRDLLNVKAAKKAIVDGFKRTDEALLRESISAGWHDGATAVCVWILGNVVFVANVGDAKAVLARVSTVETVGEGKVQSHSNKGEAAAQALPLKGLTVTREHKAIFPLERARIEKAGGYVGENGRLLGRLEVSRAFGDRQFKKVFGPSDAVEFVDSQLKEGVSVGVACRRLVKEAVRERKCKDNCTAVLITFKHV